MSKKLQSDILSKTEIGYIIKFAFDGQKTLGPKLEEIYEKTKNARSNTLNDFVRYYAENNLWKYLETKKKLKKEFFRKAYTKKDK